MQLQPQRLLLFSRNTLIRLKRTFTGLPIGRSCDLFLLLFPFLTSLPMSNSVWKAKLPDNSVLLFRPGNDISLVEEIYYEHAYDKLFQFEDGNIIIDGGSHIGVFALRAANRVGRKGTVVCIEPDP